ncbi:MAG: hypothetical protein AAGE89_00960 [Pseudomonadota bacterium]
MTCNFIGNLPIDQMCTVTAADFPITMIEELPRRDDNFVLIVIANHLADSVGDIVSGQYGAGTQDHDRFT